MQERLGEPVPHLAAARGGGPAQQHVNDPRRAGLQDPGDPGVAHVRGR
jgi:hypothetical protein